MNKSIFDKPTIENKQNKNIKKPKIINPLLPE
jgi:hypothetical protein